jgi:hypothetical protein
MAVMDEVFLSRLYHFSVFEDTSGLWIPLPSLPMRRSSSRPTTPLPSRMRWAPSSRASPLLLLAAVAFPPGYVSMPVSYVWCSSKQNDSEINPLSSTPVTLRWDSIHGTTRLRFPIDLTCEEDAAGLLRLTSSCQPASFGHNGEDVFDASYRKATKLDRSAFSVDFCPYEVGIIDTIAQMLLPNSSGSGKSNGIRAELYKLNVSHVAFIAQPSN